MSVVSSGPPTGLSSTPRENNSSRTARFPVRAQIFPHEQTFSLLRPIELWRTRSHYEMQSKNCLRASELTDDGLRWSGRPRSRRLILGAPHKLPGQVKSKSHDCEAANRGRRFSRAECSGRGRGFLCKHRAIAERSGSPPVRSVWLRVLDNSASIIWAQRSRSTSAPTAGWPDVWCWF